MADPAKEQLVDWHDLLGALLIDLFTGTPFEVSTEVPVSRKKQRLDYLVIRKHPGRCEVELPDGMGPLPKYTLISFKSHRDNFVWWTVLELLGYFVGFRKQTPDGDGKLLPESEFRLIGISARKPTKLAKEVPLVLVQPGVYDIQYGPTPIRILSIRELPKVQRNAMLKLFSAERGQVRFAVENFHARAEPTPDFVDRLIQAWQGKDEEMAATLRDLAIRITSVLSPQERLKGVPAEELVKRLSSEERLKGLPAEELVKRLSFEERLQGLAPDELEEYLKKIKKAKSKN